MPFRKVLLATLLIIPVLCFAQTPAPSMMMMKPAAFQLIDFTDLEAAQALAAKGPTVLFFSADWCPFCQADLKQFKTEGARLGGIAVVVVDYDTARDLKAKYKVAYQHTYVRIDANGDATAVWNGGGIDGILARIKKA